MDFRILFFIGIGILLFFILFFVFVMFFQRRTLWSGFSFLCVLIATAVFSFLLVARFSDTIQEMPFLFFGILFFGGLAALALFLMPVTLLLVFLIEGIKLIRKEGVHWKNMLSIGFALLLLIFLFFQPSRFSALDLPLTDTLWTALTVGVSYILFLLLMYVTSSFLNLWHMRENRKFDYIIILGSGIFGTNVPPLLAGRIERGMRLAQKNPDAVLIMSGGQGEGENIAEGEAMKRYAIAHGFDTTRILVEDQSRNTWENLAFSRKQMKTEKPRVAIVTTSFHVFRALMIARRQGMACLGYGAKTTWYFTLNAMIREFIGYLSLTWKRHLWIYAAILFLYFGNRRFLQYMQAWR